MMCFVLQVSKAGYYLWRDRAPSARAQADERLTAQIKIIHRTSRKTYGSPRVHAQLRLQGTRVGEKRVARLMKAAGLVVKTRRRFRLTTTSNHTHPIAPNVLRRRFGVAQIGALDRCWASDI